MGAVVQDLRMNCIHSVTGLYHLCLHFDLFFLEFCTLCRASTIPELGMPASILGASLLFVSVQFSSVQFVSVSVRQFEQWAIPGYAPIEEL